MVCSRREEMWHLVQALDFCSFFKMRSFGKYAAQYNNQHGKRKERRERTSTEWDVRIDATPSDADEIVTNLRSAGDDLVYALVSGIEEPDVVKEFKSDGTPVGCYGADEEHVHIALVFKEDKQRYQVLNYCRGLTKKREEYAVPRNRKFTYAGWYMHHTKWGWKLPTESSIRYEFGILPEDPTDEDTCKKVAQMYKKFGSTGALDLDHEAGLKLKFNKWM